MIDRSPHDQLVEINRYIFVKDFDQAEVMLTELAQKHPQFDLLQLRRIELSATTGKLKERVLEFKHLKNEKSVIYLTICWVLDDQADLDLAYQAAISYLEKNPDDALTLYTIGLIYETRSEINKALHQYETAIAKDHAFFPAIFALSQLHYRLDNQKEGERYFFEFQKLAPFNIYGNFETHRQVYEYFFEKKDYRLAEVAVSSLIDWWTHQKGLIPAEITLFETLTRAAFEAASQPGHHSKYIESATTLAEELIQSQEPTMIQTPLFFIALFDKYGFKEAALHLYKKIVMSYLNRDTNTVRNVIRYLQRSGSTQEAKELLDRCYQISPDHQEISKLRLELDLEKSGVELKSYESLKQDCLKSRGRDRMTGLIHLDQLYGKDPEVLLSLAEEYAQIDQRALAEKYFERLQAVDPLSLQTLLARGKYDLELNQYDGVIKSLAAFKNHEQAREDLVKLRLWLLSRAYVGKNDYAQATRTIHQLLKYEPWNPHYLALATVCETESLNQNRDENEFDPYDPIIRSLIKQNQTSESWEIFNENQKQLYDASHYTIAYNRAKIALLFGEWHPRTIDQWVDLALKTTPSQAVHELMRLINTNYDAPQVFWMIGLIYKGLWQLETAKSWFDQTMLHSQLTSSQGALISLDQAECAVWLDENLDAALQTLTALAPQLTEANQLRLQKLIAHLNIKLGKMRPAKDILANLLSTKMDIELIYLKGLIEYRNGDATKAKKIWKPLISAPSQSLTQHHIKQIIFKYYYDGQDYFRFEAS